MRSASKAVVGLMAVLAGCGGMEGDLSLGMGLQEEDPMGVNEAAVSARICPAGSTVEGIDVSKWQGSINWSAVKNSGRKFAIARISHGLSYKDEYFAQNWSGMKSVGLIRGGYQFFAPGEDAVAQANYVVQKLGRLGPGDLPAMLDVEVTDGQTPATITAKIHRWVDIVTAGTGKAPIIYTGAYFWDDHVKSADFKSTPLVIAWYGTMCPGVPNAWASTGWRFHQYSSTGSVPGISGNVDLDVFNGTLAQLNAFAGAGPVKVADAQELSLAANADGRLEAFFIDGSGAIAHQYQTAVNGGAWSAPAALGGTAVQLTVGANADGRLEVFYVGTDGRLYHRVQRPAGGWSGEVVFNAAAKELAVAMNADGRLEIFFTGTDGALFHAWQSSPNSSWVAPVALGGSAKNLTAARNANGKLTLLYAGTDDALYARTQSTAGGSFAAQVALGGKAKQVALALDADGRLHAFSTSLTNAVTHAAQATPGGAFGAGAAMGGQALKLATSHDADGRLELFYVGTNGVLYQNFERVDGTWYGELQRGASAVAVTAAENADGRIELVYAASNGALQHDWQGGPNGSFVGPAALGGSL
ncbi:MAG: hypothetical protein IPJ65_22430 [Archangiaceae bacterium]|nr:hypothetical protein [Archangiaceae bacterium]